MLSTLLASATAFPEVELTFPNLFGGITLSYYLCLKHPFNAPDPQCSKPSSSPSST